MCTCKRAWIDAFSLPCCCGIMSGSNDLAVVVLLPVCISPDSVCCAGARKLEIRPAGEKNVVAGMHSGKAEYLPFPVPIPVSGPVESWMGRVEYAMQTTVQSRIMQASCLHNLSLSNRLHSF